MIINGFDTKDISVVVQGVVKQNDTRICIDSIRKYLPDAEIIVSTWEDSDVSEIECDKIIFNKDPGADGFIRKFPFPQINNPSREIVSSFNGLKCVTRKYAMKIRSDMMLASNDFLWYYWKFGKTSVPSAVFQQRIMVEGFTTNFEDVFCVGDWWTFGLTKDLVNFYDIPLYKIEDKNYFEKRVNKKKKTYMHGLLCRYIPEQYIVYQNVKKIHMIYNSKYRYRDTCDRTPRIKQISDRFVKENFLCVEFKLSGVILPKNKNIIGPVSYEYGCTFYKWHRLCKSQGIPKLNLMQSFLFKMQKAMMHCKFLHQPRYLNIEHYLKIIQNYAKTDSVKSVSIDSSILNSEITFVVTGVLNKYLKYNCVLCLKSIRKYFADSKIILSVSNRSDISIVDGLYDEVVFNDELFNDSKKYNAYLINASDRPYTINWQQFCVFNGLQKVNTKFAVKIRTDMILENRSFLNRYIKLIKEFPKYDDKYHIFSQKVLIPSKITRDARSNPDFPYQVSDLFTFGLASDLLKIWNGRLVSEYDINFFKKKENAKLRNPCHFAHRYTAEQSFVFNLLDSSGIKYSKPKYYCDRNDDTYVFESEKIIVSNFIVDSFKNLGIKSKFTADRPPFRKFSMMNFDRFLEIYLINVDPWNKKLLLELKKYMPVKGWLSIYCHYIKRGGARLSKKIKELLKSH